MSYIRIDRALQNWRYKTKPEYVALWVEILLSANWEEKTWMDIKVKRGEFITSLEHLSERTGLSVQQVRTILKHLISNEIDVKSTNKYTLIRVLKYSKYQDNNRKLTNNQQTTNKQLTTTNKLNKYKKYISSCCIEIERYKQAGLGDLAKKIIDVAAELNIKEEYMSETFGEISEIIENKEITKKVNYAYKKFKAKGWLYE